jgi:hypothetical protein
MVIGNKIPGVVFIRKLKRGLDRAEIISDVEFPGGLEPGKRNLLHDENNVAP